MFKQSNFNMIKIKSFIKSKIIEFQKKIDFLNRKCDEQKNSYEDKLTDMNLKFIDMIDAFENIEENIKDKEESFDVDAKKLLKNLRSIKKKTVRVIKKNKIEKIVFENNKADIKTCKVIDTIQDSTKENETIVEVIKNGYLHKETQCVIRKAEVITVIK